MSAGVRVERAGRRADVVLDRPPLNILDREAIEALDRALEELAGDGELQLVRLRGAGERAFSAGVAIEDHTADQIGRALPAFHRAVRRLRDQPAITVAAVHGHCLGGGMELAIACDLVLAAADARFGQPEIKVGCFPPVAAALLPRRLGRGRALELLASGRTLDAAEAVELGIATRVAAAGELESELEALSARLMKASGAVSRLLKRAVRAGAELDFDRALDEAERLYLEELVATHDMNEGISAFLEKRDPRWQHR